ncbi:MAG: hypothetical protein JSW49_06810 [candidate division WOR-3 bacterium]|nr:MAG: hypothetical protein JSW49_06810 [candidate division WOR-3 bacterium]
MNAFILIMIATAGVKSLLMPASPTGVTTSFAMAGNEEAIFYNPANLKTGDDFAFQCSYNRFYLGMHSVSLSLGKKIKNIDVGLGIVNFDYGDVEYRPDYPTEDPLINYSAYDFSIVFGAAVDVSSKGRIGVNLKYVTENIYIYSDYGLALDVAFAYADTNSGMTFGATNFGTKLEINNEEVSLPARLSIGAFHRIGQFTFSGDLHYLTNDSAFEFGIGATMPVGQRLRLSGAVNYRDELYPGFGISVETGGLQVKYGGSFYPKNLGMVNNIAIGIEL